MFLFVCSEVFDVLWLHSRGKVRDAASGAGKEPAGDEKRLSLCQVELNDSMLPCLFPDNNYGQLLQVRARAHLSAHLSKIVKMCYDCRVRRQTHWRPSLNARFCASTGTTRPATIGKVAMWGAAKKVEEDTGPVARQEMSHAACAEHVWSMCGACREYVEHLVLKKFPWKDAFLSRHPPQEVGHKEHNKVEVLEVQVTFRLIAGANKSNLQMFGYNMCIEIIEIIMDTYMSYCIIYIYMWLCNMFQEVIDVFAQQGKLGFSAIIKVSEQVGAAKSALRKVPNQGSQARVSRKRFPSKVPKQAPKGSHQQVPKSRFPSKGSKPVPKQGFQARFPKVSRKRFKQGSQRFPKVPKVPKGSQARLPSKGSQARFPRKGFQARVPRPGCQARVPWTGFQARLPRTGSQARSPSKVFKNRFPRQVSKQGSPE